MVCFVCSHYPKTSFTIVTDTPENLRLKQQSELQSQVRSGLISHSILHHSMKQESKACFMMVTQISAPFGSFGAFARYVQSIEIDADVPHITACLCFTSEDCDLKTAHGSVLIGS